MALTTRSRRRLPVLTCLCAVALSVVAPVGDAFAQNRGSVRSTNRSSVRSKWPPAR